MKTQAGKQIEVRIVWVKSWCFVIVIVVITVVVVGHNGGLSFDAGDGGLVYITRMCRQMLLTQY